MTARIHPTAQVEPGVHLGQGVQLWDMVHVRTGAVLGDGVSVGRGAFIDTGVRVGSNCKIQNYACLYKGAELDDGAFIGPGAILLNDRLPRAINPDGSRKGASDWTVEGVRIGYGAAIGGGAVVNPGVRIGRWAMIGAGALVSRDVPDHGLYAGTPARIMGYVCPRGDRLSPVGRVAAGLVLRGPDGFELIVPDAEEPG